MESRNTNISLFRNLDWVTITIYLVMIIAGVFSIYAASYDFDHASLFASDEFSGKQIRWIGLALVLGVLFVWSPIISIVLAAIGISRARMGLGSSKSGMAKAGKILCIIGAIVAVILWVWNLILTVGMIV